MKLLVVHNAYQQRGGEDAVVDSEIALLRAHGHSVSEYRRDNREIDGDAPMSRAALAMDTLWSRRTTREVGALLHEQRPDIVHVHNTFPLISPSVYSCVARAGVSGVPIVPIVQTLHNFRLACPQAMFLRDGRVCEDCLGRVPWRGVLHACYRASTAQSAVAAASLQLHRVLGSGQRHVARWIALSEFSRGKFLQAGLPAERMVVLGQFVESPRTLAEHEPATGPAPARSGLLFVGRLAPEKGLAVLAQAVTLARATRPSLSVDLIGDGPEQASLQGVAGLRLLGARAPAEVMAAMQRATAVLLPSLSYENFPRTLVEAFACGTPVIASRLGALAELVVHGRTGWHVDAGDAGALAQALLRADDEDHAGELAAMGHAARAEYEARYTPTLHHAALMSIYAAARDELRGLQGRSR